MNKSIVLVVILLATPCYAQPFTLNTADTFPIVEANGLTGEDWTCPTYPADRCYITTTPLGPPVNWQLQCPPPSDAPQFDTGSRMSEYIMNGAKAVSIPGWGVLYHVQANNKAPCLGGRNVAGDCLQNNGPFGIQNAMAGDEWWLFKCPVDDPACFLSPPQLVQDTTRPSNNGNCSIDTDPSCDLWGWQVKTTDYNNGNIRLAAVAQAFSAKVSHNGVDGFPVGSERLTKGTHLVVQITPDTVPSQPSITWNRDGSGSIFSLRSAFSTSPDTRWCDGTYGFCSATNDGTTQAECSALSGTWTQWLDASCPASATRERIAGGNFIRPINPTRCLPAAPGATGSSCVGPQGQLWTQQPINWVGFIASLRDTSTFLTNGGYCFEPEQCSQAFGEWRNTFSVMSFGVGTWLAVYTNNAISDWVFVPWGSQYTQQLPGSPFVHHRVIDTAWVTTVEVARVVGSEPTPEIGKSLIIQQRGPIASTPVGSDPCGVGDTTIFYHNFPVDEGLPTNCVKETWSGPFPNSERVFSWSWFDQDTGALETTSGTDARTEMSEFTGLPSSIYRADFVGWLATYFEHIYINQRRRYLLFGSKDSTACHVAERYTFDQATGRGLWTFRLQLDAEQVMSDSVLMPGPHVFSDGFETGTTENWILELE